MNDNNYKNNCVYRILKHSFVPLISSTGMVYRRLALRVSGRAIALLLLSLVSLLFVVSSATANPAFTLAAANYQPVKGQPYTAVLPNGVTLKMLWCPAGSFDMGSTENELGRSNDELLHQVTLTQGFWLGQYEVTQEQYLAVIGRNPSELTGNADRPVENVRWEEALAFCQILNDLLGSKLPAGCIFSLPTEAQWEYACRAETGSALNSGEELISEGGSCANLNRLGWYDKNSGGSTHLVGQKLPNAWGFYDMHGNVWEWCRDWYGYYQGAANDPIGVGNGKRRVVRGGSWNYKALNCRSACRSNLTPDNRSNNVGFRLMLSAPQASNSLSTSVAADSKPVNGQTTEVLTKEREIAQTSSSSSTSVAVSSKPVNDQPTEVLTKERITAQTSSSSSTSTAADSRPVNGQPYTAVLPNGITLKMLWCPAGSFVMGRREFPLLNFFFITLFNTQHQVTLTQGFWLGQYEVTQEQYLAVIGMNPSQFTGNDNRPVESVSWYDAMAFCQRLNDLLGPMLPAGYRFTLPTDAQWEYACRAGTSSALNSGEDLSSSFGVSTNLNRLGWYDKNSGGCTHPVGQKLPNVWGFYDMHGNVWEWCRDWYGDLGGAATDPTGLVRGDKRVVRGASWSAFADSCDCAIRAPLAPSNSNSGIGFRPVLAPVQ